MSILFDVGAVISAVLMGYLLYLVLFERGTLYRTSTEVHGLDDQQRLRLLSALLGTPPQRIDSTRVLREGPELYDVQLAAIAAAQRSIHLEAYIYYPGRIADALLAALCERARCGVRVRVVIDAIGSMRTGPSYFEPLIAAGGQVNRYHPLHLHMLRRWNSRTHRNLLVVDGEVGFIGGAGIADHWCRSAPLPWRDCTLRVTGPIVAGLQAVFAENWLESAGELLVGPDAFPGGNLGDLHNDAGTLGLAIGSTPTAGRSTRARVLVQLRHCGGALPFGKFLKRIVLDDPQRNNDDEVDYFSMAFGALRLAMQESGLDVPIERRVCRRGCVCVDGWAEDAERLTVMFDPKG